jgi:hypothetical protein
MRQSASVRAEIVGGRVSGHFIGVPFMTDRPYTTRAKQALELADTAAERLGHPYIGTEHILIGLLDEKRGPAAQILTKLGVTAEGVREELRKALLPPT